MVLRFNISLIILFKLKFIKAFTASYTPLCFYVVFSYESQSFVRMPCDTAQDVHTLTISCAICLVLLISSM